MDKLLFRRISAAIVLVSFFLPWLNVLFLDLTGFQIITEGFKGSESVALATIVLVLGVLALLVVLIPKLIPTILFLIPGSLWLLMMFTAEKLKEQRSYGIVVFLVGVIGIIISFFLKRKDKVPANQVVIAQQEVASTYVNPQVISTTPIMDGNASKKYCSRCGREHNVTSKFCASCGNSI